MSHTREPVLQTKENVMTIAELIARLEDFDQSCEVRLAIQPSWPFEHSIADVQQSGVTTEVFETGDGEPKYAGEEPVDVVYLLEGGQIGYLPSGAVTF